MANKRSYTVPVLLLIIVVLTTIIVMVYSKLLLAQQQHKTDVGQRLAEQYLQATAYTDRLSEGTGLLLQDGSTADRLRGTRLLGEAIFSSRETAVILAEAAHRSAGTPLEQDLELISAGLTKVNDTLSDIAEHDGPLTAEEKRMLTTVQQDAGQMVEALHRFHVPSGAAGFRQMAFGGDWVDAANNAAKGVQLMAAKLQ